MPMTTNVDRLSHRLLAATKAQRELGRSRAMHRLLLCGELSAEQYQQLLWMHRQLLSAAEDAVWSAPAQIVARVRAQATRRVGLAERDLVGACGKRLEIPAPLNALLDEWTTQARRTTAPAQLLGRLFALEGLPIDYRSVPESTLHQRLGVARTHYFVSGGEQLFDDFRRFCEALDGAGLDRSQHDEAIAGARDMYAILDRCFELIGRLTVGSGRLRHSSATSLRAVPQTTTVTERAPNRADRSVATG